SREEEGALAESGAQRTSVTQSGLSLLRYRQSLLSGRDGREPAMAERLVVDSTLRWRVGVRNEASPRARISRGRSGLRDLLHEASGFTPEVDRQQPGLPLVWLFGRLKPVLVVHLVLLSPGSVNEKGVEQCD